MRLAAPIDLYFLAIISIIRATSWFPCRRVRIAVAKILAALSYNLSRNKRKAMSRAIAAALGDQPGQRGMVRIVKGSLYNLWLEILGSIPGRIDLIATGRAQIIGWEHLEHSLAAGKGAILWESGSFGRRFWAKQILCRKGVRVHQLRGSNHLGCLAIDDASSTWLRQHLIRPFFDNAERAYYADMVYLPPTGDLAYGRTLLRKLGQNAVLSVAADGETGAKRRTVPFLGTTYDFATGMPSLARISGTPIIPVVCLETDDGKACLIIEEPIRPGDDEDRERQAEGIIRSYAQLMEGYIRRDPAMYRNWHLLARDEA